MIVKGAVPYYRLKGKDGNMRTWFTGGGVPRVFGFPQWVYHFPDSRPLPMDHVKIVDREIEQTIKEKQSDGTVKESVQKRIVPVVVAGAPIDPLLIDSAFNTEIIEKFNELGNAPPSKLKWGLMGFAIFFIIILAGLAVYYSYYFGINIACAVHAHNVNCA